MRKIVLGIIITSFVTSCNSDHKKETILNYLQYVRKRQPGEIEIKKLDEVKLITGKDSIDLLIQEYASDIKPTPTLDTVLSHIEKDIAYNSRLLARTNKQIDSIGNFQKKLNSDDEFVKAYVKSFTDLRDFTSQQIDELKGYQGSFKRYSTRRDEIFCYEIFCQYKLKGHAPDTTSKMVTQTFFLSPDTRKIYLVK